MINVILHLPFIWPVCDAANNLIASNYHNRFVASESHLKGIIKYLEKQIDLVVQANMSCTFQERCDFKDFIPILGVGIVLNLPS